MRITKAADDVLAERQRQIQQEGWTEEHDDQHREGEMANAAATYAMTPDRRSIGVGEDVLDYLWPWSADWWKPTDRRRDLVKAGALILAEIERLDRLAQTHPGERWSRWGDTQSKKECI